MSVIMLTGPPMMPENIKSNQSIVLFSFSVDIQRHRLTQFFTDSMHLDMQPCSAVSGAGHKQVLQQ